MRTRPKDLGTRWETFVVTAARAMGLVARRLAEGGRYDEADVEIHDAAGRRYLIECKDRSALNAHGALEKARLKAGDDARVALVWRRMVRTADSTRRRSAGPAVVVVQLPVFLDLLARASDREAAA